MIDTQVTVTGLCGDKDLAKKMMKKGLNVSYEALFFEDQDNLVKGLQTFGGEKQKGFTSQLKRNVVLTAYGRGSSKRTLQKMEECMPEFKAFVQKMTKTTVDGATPYILDLWLSYYKMNLMDLENSNYVDMPNMTRNTFETFGEFDWHRDAGLTGNVECRLVGTLGWKAALRKKMFFTDRKTGSWFGFEVPHGTIVTVDRSASGYDDGRYQHKVVDAEGTYAFVIQVSLFHWILYQVSTVISHYIHSCTVQMGRE